MRPCSKAKLAKSCHGSIPFWLSHLPCFFSFPRFGKKGFVISCCHVSESGPTKTTKTQTMFAAKFFLLHAFFAPFL